MKERPWLHWILTAAVSAALAFIGAKWGIHIPPPPPLPATPPPVIIQPPPPAPKVEPPAAPEPKADAPAAIGRIQFGTAGCTATVIGPRREDGRWWVLTAAHCVRGIGQHGVMRLKDGRTTGITVAAVNERADCCWCVTETNSEVYPFAVLARQSPVPGTRVWHAGYGVHVPGNREDGQVEAGPDQNGQIRMRLSVSSGDSGGAICLNEQDEVVSCVCCTTAKGQVAQVWGASPEAIHRAKPTSMALDDWNPVEIPVRPAEVPQPMPPRP